MPMKIKGSEMGNGQGVRLSRQIFELADIAIGDDVQIIVGDGQITVKKAGCKTTWQSWSLVSRSTIRPRKWGLDRRSARRSCKFFPEGGLKNEE